MRTTAFIFVFILGMIACGSPGNEQSAGPGHRISPVKVVIIGFDGATWDTLQAPLDRGWMPNLAGMIHSGVHGPLKTIRPTLTPVIWTTIATGKLPEKHGITGIIIEDPEKNTRSPLNASLIHCKTIWEMLSSREKRSTIVRWPVSWPAKPLSGELVSEFSFQKQRQHRTYPEPLSSLVDQKIPRFRLNDIQELTGIDQQSYEVLAPEWQWKLMVALREYSLDILYRDVSLELLKNGQPDLTAIYFYSMDAIGHSFLKFGIPDGGVTPDDPDFSGLIPNWCRLYDRFLGDILAAIDPDSYVLICSDHGMKPALKPQNFLIRSENDPPRPGETDREVPVSPGPPYDSDPLALKLEYTLPSGQHVDAPDGILVVTGPGVRTGLYYDQVSVADITPTLLYVMGLPVASDFEGVVRTELFEDAFNHNQEIRSIDTYETTSPESSPNPIQPDRTVDDDLILNRLEALGYIQ